MSTRPILKFLTFISASADRRTCGGIHRRGGAAGAHCAPRATGAGPRPAPAPVKPVNHRRSTLPLRCSRWSRHPAASGELLRRSRGARRAGRGQHLHRPPGDRAPIQPSAIEAVVWRHAASLPASASSKAWAPASSSTTAGHVITNHHVIDKADLIRAQLADGRIADVKIVGRDPDTDLAVLQLDLKKDIPVMPLGHSDQLRVGDVVLAIGNPVGLSQTVTQGIVSATGRGQLGVATFENFIQTDAPINVGNSGGALDQYQWRAHRHQHRGAGQEPRRRRHRLRHPGEPGARRDERNPHQGPRGARLDRHRAAGRRRLRGAAQQPAAGRVSSCTSSTATVPRRRRAWRRATSSSPSTASRCRAAQDTLTRIANAKPGAKVKITGLRGTQNFRSEVLVSERPRPAASAERRGCAPQRKPALRRRCRRGSSPTGGRRRRWRRSCAS